MTTKELISFIKDNDIPQKRISEKSGIPYSSLRLKLNGHRKISDTDIDKIKTAVLSILNELKKDFKELLDK